MAKKHLPSPKRGSLQTSAGSGMGEMTPRGCCMLGRGLLGTGPSSFVGPQHHQHRPWGCRSRAKLSPWDGQNCHQDPWGHWGPCVPWEAEGGSGQGGGGRLPSYLCLESNHKRQH